MPYVITVTDVFRVLELGTPEKPFWGHCLIDGTKNVDGPEIGFSCAITFGDAKWSGLIGQQRPISFYWDELPTDYSARNLIFFSGSVKVLQGQLDTVS